MTNEAMGSRLSWILPWFAAVRDEDMEMKEGLNQEDLSSKFEEVSRDLHGRGETKPLELTQLCPSTGFNLFLCVQWASPSAS
jgi:hypothetical protein